MRNVHDITAVRERRAATVDQEMLDYFQSQPPSLTRVQCTQARAMLDWSVEALAFRSGVSIKAINQYEAGTRELLDVTRQALAFAFEAEGLLLICEKPMFGANCRGATVDPRQRKDYHRIE